MCHFPNRTHDFLTSEMQCCLGGRVSFLTPSWHSGSKNNKPLFNEKERVNTECFLKNSGIDLKKNCETIADVSHWSKKSDRIQKSGKYVEFPYSCPSHLGSKDTKQSVYKSRGPSLCQRTFSEKPLETMKVNSRRFLMPWIC